MGGGHGEGRKEGGGKRIRKALLCGFKGGRTKGVKVLGDEIV